MHRCLIMHGFHNGKWLILCSKTEYKLMVTNANKIVSSSIKLLFESPTSTV